MQPPTPRYGGLSDLSGRTHFVSFILILWRFPIPTSLAMNCDNNKRALGAELWCKSQPPRLGSHLQEAIWKMMGKGRRGITPRTMRGLLYL
jgi:hypothetical protein